MRAALAGRFSTMGGYRRSLWWGVGLGQSRQKWGRLPAAEDDPTVRAHAAAEGLLDRHGVVTRGAVAAEEVPGGFAAVHRVLGAAEEAGQVRRGYFVEGLGASQFAAAGAVDQVRSSGGADGDVDAPGGQCDPDRDLGFTLHGLWPQRDSGGWPEYCETEARDPTRRETAAMADIMGSGGLAWYQWKKHGRCSGLPARGYYALARAADPATRLASLPIRPGSPRQNPRIWSR